MCMPFHITYIDAYTIYLFVRPQPVVTAIHLPSLRCEAVVAGSTVLPLGMSKPEHPVGAMNQHGTKRRGDKCPVQYNFDVHFCSQSKDTHTHIHR